MTDQTRDQQEFKPGRVYERVMPWLLMFAGAVFGFALISVLPHETCDEGFHAPQIWGFFAGSHVISPALTMPPTYHYIIGTALRQIGYYSVPLARLISAVVALLALPVFYRLARGYHFEEAPVRTLQFFFLPAIFPFFFLLYTDLWALLAVLAMMWFTLRRQHLLAAALGLLSLLLKQDNIMWVGLAFLIVCCEEPDEDEDGSAGRGVIARMVKNGVRRGWPYTVLFVLFGVFVLVNHGVSLGDRSLQQAKFNVTNFWFFLICAWGLFLPHHLSRLPAILRLLRRPWVVAALAAGFFVYFGTYHNAHQYNQPELSFYLRNRLLAVMTASLVWRALLYVPLAWAVLSFAVTRLAEPRLAWLFAVAPVFICLHPVIDQRYYFVPLAFWLAWRRPDPPGWELLTVFCYLPVTAWLTFGIAGLQFFL